MRRRSSLRFVAFAAAAIIVCGAAGWSYLAVLEPEPVLAEIPVQATRDPGAGLHEWTHFAADAGATQYSPLAQITPDNVGGLRVAWTYRTGEAARRGDELARSSFAATPILVAESLVTCTPWGRVVALDPATGAERWIFDPAVTLTQPPDHRYICRGVAYWRDPGAAPGAPCAERILLGTNDLRVFALDVESGRPCTGFARNGELRVAAREQRYLGELQFNGPPAIVNGVVVLGSSVSDHVRPDAPSGAVRAFDARTGTPLWTFDPVPRAPADPAAASWGNGSAATTGAANVWADMSVDEARDLVFVSTSSPALDFDGRGRPGDNRYANSIVALRGSTGRVVWHYQIVHHDLWDYDLPSAGLLTRIRAGGELRDALIQITKQGLVFVLDRETGLPLFPVEERPVAQSDVPGERTSPTQPFPTTLPWLMGVQLEGADFSADDAWGFTFWDRAHCRERLEQHRALGLYGPPSAAGTLMYPWLSGGANHGMRAYDPARGLLIVSLIRTVGVLYAPEGNWPSPGRPPGSDPLLSPLGAPCLKPPWGELVALDIERQQIAWRVPLGTLEKLAGWPAWLPSPLAFGTPSRGGPMLTGGGLVFVGGTMDDAFRAFDTATGEELWRDRLPAGGQATPMTYLADSRQFVVIAAGGHYWMETTPGDYLVAYALPD